MKLRTALIPAAGRGKRMHPFTQVVPKELLPLSPRPAIGYIADELALSGIERIVVVVAPDKELVVEYLNWWNRHENPVFPVEIVTVMQDEAHGLGDAVLMAAGAVEDPCFAVVLPDDLIVGSVPALVELGTIAEQHKAPVIATTVVPAADTHRYGIISYDPVLDISQNGRRIVSIIEKPLSNPPSYEAVVGRYILPVSIFSYLQELKKVHQFGELQLTSALNVLCADRAVYGYTCSGARFDIGTPPGWAAAVARYTVDSVSSI